MDVFDFIVQLGTLKCAVLMWQRVRRLGSLSCTRFQPVAFLWANAVWIPGGIQVALACSQMIMGETILIRDWALISCLTASLLWTPSDSACFSHWIWTLMNELYIVLMLFFMMPFSFLSSHHPWSHLGTPRLRRCSFKKDICAARAIHIEGQQGGSEIEDWVSKKALS